MNNTLTGLGLALVLALVAALVGPWFVNWDAYRDDFADQAGALVGAPVKVSGAVDVRLLPSPYVRFRDVVAGEGDARFAASEIEITLGVGPLLRGDVSAQSIKIVRPRLTLAVGPDGAVRTPFGANAAAGPDADRVSFDRAEIVDGAIELTSPVGRLAMTKLSGVAEAGSLKGPYRFDGTGATPLGRTTVRLSTSRADGAGGVRLKLAVSVEGRPETFDADGLLTVARQPRFDGQGILLRPAPKEPPAAGAGRGGTPWRLAAKIAGDPTQLAFEEIDASYGPDDRAVRLAGRGTLALSAEPHFDLTLAARQVDLDRIVATTGGSPAARLQAFVAPFRAAAAPPLDGRLALDIGGLVAAGDVVRNIRAELTAEAGAWRIDDASGQFPAETTISGRGAVALVGGAPGFAGAVDFATGDLGGFRAWLQGGGDAPRAAVRQLGVRGDVTARIGAVTLANARLTADGAASSGQIAWRGPDGGARARIDADLTSDRLDLDALGFDRLVAGALNGGGDTDVKLKLDAEALTLLGVAFEKVEIDAEIDQSGVDIRKLLIGDAGGASLSGAGQITAAAAGPEGQISVDVEAKALDGLFALARAAGAPEQAVVFAEARAAAFAPATLSVDVGTAASGWTIAARGTAAGGPFDARLSTSAFALDAETDIAATVRSPDGPRLAALVGVALSPVASLPGGELSLRLNGAPSRGLSGEGRIAAFGIELGARGDIVAAPEVGLSAAGDVTLKSQNLTAVAEALGRLVPGAAPAVPVDLAARLVISAEQAAVENLKGNIGGRSVEGRLTAPYDPKKGLEGDLAFEELPLAVIAGLALSPDAFAVRGPARRSVWPSAAFGPSPLGGVTGKVAVSAARMPLGGEQLATDAAFTLAARPGAVAIENLTARLAGGALSGGLNLSRPGLEATVALRASLKGARAERLIELRAASPVAGALDVSFDAQGTGRTISALVATMSGTGTATLVDGVLRGLDAGALDRVEPQVEAGLALEAPKIAAAVERTIGAADLRIDRVIAPFTLSGGVLRSGVLDHAGGPARLGGSIALDLTPLTLDADLTLAPRREDAPQLGVAFEGPLAAPKRRIDATALTGWLSVRAVERETRRIEAMEAEIQERARLARERAAAEERRRAEEKRRADEARLKAEEERRRKEAEERARRALQPPASPTTPEPPALPPLDITPPGIGSPSTAPGSGAPFQLSPARPRAAPPQGVFDVAPQ